MAVGRMKIGKTHKKPFLCVVRKGTTPRGDVKELFHGQIRLNFGPFISWHILRRAGNMEYVSSSEEEDDYGHLFDFDRVITRSISHENLTEMKSPWESNSGCPMTTRPYFERPHAVLRKTRSRSLGSYLEGPPSDPVFLEELRKKYSISGSQLQPFDGVPVQMEGPSLIAQPQILTRYETPPLSLSPKPSPSRSLSRSSPKITARRHSHKEETSVLTSFIYGMINATIVLPVLMSFSSIIYRDQAFLPYSNVLVKLTLASGIVHQLCFSTFSSLPFAVGQVQDAGLIFLSSMASNIVKYCRDRKLDDEAILATSTVGLSLCTGLLGVALVGIGKLRLAQYVQLLPTSVVGGYLAYIGWFCGLSGVGLMANDPEVTFSLFIEKFFFVLPGLLGGLGIYVSASYLKHMAVLPCCILALLLIFYVLLWTTDTSVAEATENGWIRKMHEPPRWFETWKYFAFDKVQWYALPQLLLTEISMIFVVALSSSLDVAAIELELGRPLDYNHELGTVGISNIISGFSGGYTGSYIFSQSIFSLRAGIRSRLSGYFLALCQVVVFLLPFPILSFIPNFFFGSLLSMICIDLMYEWLFDVRTKVTQVEYSICLCTFILIQLTNIEYGIVMGVVIYLLCRKSGLDVGEARITTVESKEEEQKIDLLEDRIRHSDYGGTHVATPNGGAQFIHAQPRYHPTTSI